MSEKPFFHTTVMERRKVLELQLSLQQDIEQLLIKFESMSSFRFAPFCDLWKEMKFGLIYAGKYRTQDFGHYNEMVYSTVKKYFMLTNSLCYQVGAVYLLYALYYKNPLLHLVKIRLLKNEFERLLEIKDFMKSRRELQFLYIFDKMLRDQVFDFVRAQYSLGIETRFSMNDLTLVDNIFRTGSNITQRVNFVTENAISRIQSTEDEYRELLKKYMEQNDINISTSSFNLNEEINEIWKKQEPVRVKIEPEACTSVASKRNQIRSKAFKKKKVEKRAAYLDNFED